MARVVMGTRGYLLPVRHAAVVRILRQLKKCDLSPAPNLPTLQARFEVRS